MKNTKTIDVDATVTPTNEPGVRGKVEHPAPEAKPPATKAQLNPKQELSIQLVGLVIVAVLSRFHRHR